ncbi:DUF1284 domain-containing protein [Halalkalibacter alkaliphilus]|uniref:DUF1284 domain-containing protein n=1 Tax=Halalkalibacter alkaliphilus TaxID=2917993 RepID=A0A9X2CUU4_9BACI|nr:DUF1284 domain-containing protein [Halalkalibacter alkaliphilus]MCL7748662.1 DUF1284 domain-containing protein [Halalkalibacter alkaliphilus]
MYKLRGHHLFCLLGYRGMGYSREYVENMTQLHQTLRENPDTWIQLVEGPDDLCDKYPNSGEYHCHSKNIYEKDIAILAKMELKIGQIVKWKYIESCIRKHTIPTDIKIICETCSWRSFGYCEEGVQEIHEGKGLREVK